MTDATVSTSELSIIAPELTNTNGQITTTSLQVAQHFDKRHADVLRAISKLDCSKEFTERNFALSEFEDSTGRKLPMFHITKDGFMFLAMGFTGKEAAQWKEAYITAFNKMEATLLRTPRGNLDDFQEHTQRIEREMKITAAAKLFTSTHKSLSGLGLSQVAHASRANQIVRQATGVDYLGLAGNPHIPENLELFEREPVCTTKRASMTPIEKLLACIANGSRYKATPDLSLTAGIETTHSELLRHTRMKGDEFRAAVDQAIAQNLIRRKTTPGYGGTIYVLVQGEGA